MPTAMMQFSNRIKNGLFRRCVMLTITLFIAFMVIGRLLSGVHWITDIIGGALFSAAIVLMYYSIGNIVAKNC
jgi:undecaprenyl-diphosphatase